MFCDYVRELLIVQLLAVTVCKNISEKEMRLNKCLLMKNEIDNGDRLVIRD